MATQQTGEEIRSEAVTGVASSPRPTAAQQKDRGKLLEGKATLRASLLRVRHKLYFQN